MTRGTLKSLNPRNRNSISVINSKFLSVSSMNTLLAILKVTNGRRDVILAGGLNHRFSWKHLPSLHCPQGYKLARAFWAIIISDRLATLLEWSLNSPSALHLDIQRMHGGRMNQLFYNIINVAVNFV